MLVDLPTFESLVVTVAVTIIRTVVESSPTLLGGIAVAAWLRTLATPQRVKEIFRGEGIEGLIRTVLVGMTVPVCSIGVLPVLRELRRLGLPTGKLVTFGLVCPLLNPISLLYAFTVLSGTQLLLIVTAAFSLAIIVGDISSRFAGSNAVTAAERPAGLTGATRLRNLVIASARIATGWLLADLLIVAVVSGLVASLIPEGTFGNVCDVSNQGGSALASLLLLPQYVGPAHGVIQLVAIEKAGLSIPTGLAVYVFGVGMSAGNVLLLIRWYGLKRIAATAIALFLFVCLTAFASGFVLNSAVEAAEETSGFDSVTRPVHATFRQIDKSVVASLKLTDPLTMVGALALLILAPAGGIVRIAKIDYRNDDPDAQDSEDGGRMSKAVPASQLGAVAVCGIGIVCCLATYIFFPGPTECMEDMQTIQLDANIALRQGNIREALRQLAAWDSIAAKLPVSAAVHFSFPTASQRQTTRDLRMALHNTRVLLLEGDDAGAREQISVLMQLLSETKTTFSGGSS